MVGAPRGAGRGGETLATREGGGGASSSCGARGRARRGGLRVARRPGSRSSRRMDALEDGDVSSVLTGPASSVVNHDFSVSLDTRKAREGARNSARQVGVPASSAPRARFARGLGGREEMATIYVRVICTGEMVTICVLDESDAGLRRYCASTPSWWSQAVTHSPFSATKPEPDTGLRRYCASRRRWRGRCLSPPLPRPAHARCPPTPLPLPSSLLPPFPPSDEALGPRTASTARLFRAPRL